MQPLRIMTLDLRSPLRYRLSTCADPFGQLAMGERMARFDLDGRRSAAVEIDPADYLGPPAAVAETTDSTDASSAPEAEVVIPVGRYLFAQFRPDEGHLGADLFAAAALELQKDGLWRALALEPCVYLRLLAEGGGTVVQVLRPIASARERARESAGENPD